MLARRIVNLTEHCFKALTLVTTDSLAGKEVVGVAVPFASSRPLPIRSVRFDNEYTIDRLSTTRVQRFSSVFFATIL